MRKWMLACAVVTVAGFWADAAPAQEPIQAPTPVVVPAQTMTTAPRTGLFGRLRARRQGMVVSQPVVLDSTTTQVKTMPTLQPVRQAQATNPGTGTNVQQAQYPPIQGGVQQAQATTTSTMPTTVMPMQTVQPRQGLFARMRARRGYY